MAKPETPLEQFLNSAGSLGEFESSAGFTINTLKARKKLAGHQLPQEGLWLVKLVQAAVSCSARKMEITFGRREVEVLFEVEDWPWEPERLLHDFLAGVLPTETALFHLFAGLRNSMSDDALEAKWCIVTSEKTLTITFDSEGTVVQQGSGGTPSSFRLLTRRPSRWSKLRQAIHSPIARLLQQTADEFMAVHSYCWPCPIPLVLDGRPLENKYVPSLGLYETGNYLNRSMSTAHLSTAQIRPMTLVQRSLEGPFPLHIPWKSGSCGDEQHLEHQGQSFSLKKRLYMGESWIEWPLAEAATGGGYLLLLFGAPVEARVEFICDGAVVDTHPLPWSGKSQSLFSPKLISHNFQVSVRVLLPVRAAQLDLSHFRVREPEALLAEWQTPIVTALRESCEVVLLHTSDFHPVYTKYPDGLAIKALGEGLHAVMKFHPFFYYVTRYSFQKEIRAILNALPT